jgi:hypothetical protein
MPTSAAWVRAKASTSTCRCRPAADVAAWFDALEQACTARCNGTCADALVVSLGLDTFAGDPISSFPVAGRTTFHAPGRSGWPGCDLPTVFVLEGGYAAAELGINAVQRAGVVGLAVARALALAGHEVMVLEAADAIGTGTSSRNSEVIHAGLYYPPARSRRSCACRGALLYALLRRARRRPPRCGKLIVATAKRRRKSCAALRRPLPTAWTTCSC